MPHEDFSKADAESLISIAQDAPIPGGARQAALRSELYQRFARFYEKAVKPAPAPRGRPRKEVSAPPVAAEDLTK